MFSCLVCGQELCIFVTSFCRGGARFEPEAIVPGFDDVAVMGKTIQQGGRHFWVTEDARPFAEAEVRGDDDAGALIKFTQQVKE
jgi:hypothetical protein